MPTTPEQQAANIAESKRGLAEGKAQQAMVQKMRANAGSSGSYVGDMSTFSAKQAQQSLAMVEKMISTGALKSFNVIMANGSTRTNSLETMAEWLRQKAGPVTETTSAPSAGALVNVSA